MANNSFIINDIESAVADYQEKVFYPPTALLLNPCDYNFVVDNIKISSVTKIYATEGIKENEFKLF